MFSGLRLPSPAMAVALIALLVGASGLAAASIPDSKGVIHACYAKNGGSLRVVKGSTCATGEKSLSWSRGTGPVTVRRAELVLHYKSCFSVTPPPNASYTCSAPAKSAIAACRKGERATGGGYGEASDSAGFTPVATRPSPLQGAATGWFVKGSGFATSPGPGHTDSRIPLYVACAAP